MDAGHFKRQKARECDLRKWLYTVSIGIAVTAFPAFILYYWPSASRHLFYPSESWSIPNILLYLSLSLNGFALAIFIGIQFKYRSPFKCYFQDEINGVLWRWEYDRISETNYRVINLVPYCKDCFRQLMPERLEEFDSDKWCTYRCRKCQFTWSKFRYKIDDPTEDIRLIIDERIGTGEWKRRVRSYA